MKAAFRVLAFVSKEIQSIFVQPQLLLLLVAGPFLVLLIFGLGYRAQAPELKTIVVEPPPESGQQAVGYYLSAVGPPLRIVQLTPDLAPALQQLQARKVDLVVVVPAGIRSTLLEGQSARLVYYYNTIDPSLVGYISAVVDGATSQLNREILKLAVGDQQASAADYEMVLQQLQSDLTGIRTALQQNDRPGALDRARTVRLNAELVASLWLFSAEPLSSGGAPAAQLVEEARHLDTLLADSGTAPEALDAAISKMQGDIGTMLQRLETTQRIPPEVLVSPLVWETKAISAYQPGYVAYHSPTVLALLVQHLCVTLAALSLVDERNAGAIEIFRVAPVSPGEILLGKFLAYALLVSVTVLALVLLLKFGLAVPLLGDWRWFVLVIAALMAHSLCLGFTISALATSRSQAIQMSMLALLGSIFFSGFFISLHDFVPPVRLISYSLPVTYGIEDLRQIVLRGEAPQLLFLGLLGIWAACLGVVSVRLLSRLFVTR